MSPPNAQWRRHDDSTERIGIASGTLIGFMATGFLAVLFCWPIRWGGAPGNVCVPGRGGDDARFLRSSRGRCESANHAMGRGTAGPLGQTLSLVVSTIVLTGAIAVGLAIPLSRRLPSLIKARPPTLPT